MRHVTLSVRMQLPILLADLLVDGLCHKRYKSILDSSVTSCWVSLLEAYRDKGQTTCNGMCFSSE